MSIAAVTISDVSIVEVIHRPSLLVCPENRGFTQSQATAWELLFLISGHSGNAPFSPRRGRNLAYRGGRDSGSEERTGGEFGSVAKSLFWDSAPAGG